MNGFNNLYQLPACMSKRMQIKQSSIKACCALTLMGINFSDRFRNHDDDVDINEDA
jgi:hypothetical protein